MRYCIENLEIHSITTQTHLTLSCVCHAHVITVNLVPNLVTTYEIKRKFISHTPTNKSDLILVPISAIALVNMS